MTVPQAEYIMYEGDLLVVLFSRPLTKAEQATLNEQLANLPVAYHDYVGADVDQVGRPSAQMFALRILPEVQGSAALEQMIVALKGAVNPKLAVTIARLILNIDRCPCDKHRSAVARIGFLPGTEPSQGENHFMSEFYARVVRLKMSELIEAPHVLQIAVREILRTMGAVTLNISLSIESKDCPPPPSVN